MDKFSTPAALVIAGLLCACSASTQRKLEGRVFDIPKLHNISDSDAPFFLPALNPQDGFSFYLNPEAARPDRNLIEVASKMRMCARAAGTEARINSTVCAALSMSWRGLSLHKVSDGVFWTYDLPTAAEKKSPASLASCFVLSGDSQSGLCTASLPYGNLVLTIHFRDDQIASLEPLYDCLLYTSPSPRD